MTAPQAVFAGAAAVVLVSIVLVCVGVSMLMGVGWALIAAGGQLALAAVSGSAVLLRDDAPSSMAVRAAERERGKR